VDAPEDPILQVGIAAPEWPMPHSKPPRRRWQAAPAPVATTEVEYNASGRVLRARHGNERRVATHQDHTSLETALASLSDQSNRTASMQAQMLLLGAGAAADAKIRNRELVERNQELQQHQRKLETELAAVRELKNRVVILSQENARCERATASWRGR
jgi:hypothetical protein